MRFIVLGGAGDMGSRAVEDLCASDGVTEVTIADRDAVAAGRLAARLEGGAARVRVRVVDARDHDELVRVIAGHDVAASALGPFHAFEVPLARAAIEAGVDYASICDEWQAAEAVHAELDAPARDRGRTVLSGLGASPGLSNVGARYLADRMDRARRVEVAVYQPLAGGGGEAVLRHMAFIMMGEAALHRGGRSLRIPACSEERVVELPRFGGIRVWNLGHSEPLTLPRSMPELQDVVFSMGFGTGGRALVAAARRGALATPRRLDAAVRLAKLAERPFAGRPPAWGAVRVDVHGERDGRPVHELVCGVGEMRETTGLSLSVGAQMLARGELTARGGVLAPEACLPPVPFIRAMRARGVEAFHDLAMRRPVSP